MLEIVNLDLWCISKTESVIWFLNLCLIPKPVLFDELYNLCELAFQ